MRRGPPQINRKKNQSDELTKLILLWVLFFHWVDQSSSSLNVAL